VFSPLSSQYSPALFIDFHLHLQDEACRNDLSDIITRARDSGVGKMVVNGTSPNDWSMVAKICCKENSTIPCFGLHPWYVNDVQGSWKDELERMLHSIPSGVGEIGLDRWIDGRDEEKQEDAFRFQLDLACKLSRPVSVHCLKAWGWLIDILNETGLPEHGLALHAYGGSAESMKQLAEMGAYFSFAGEILLEKRTRAREALRLVPPERLLIETDSPDMLPPDAYINGKTVPGRNEPCNVPLIYEGIAEFIGCDLESLKSRVWDNACRFFGDIFDWSGK
ncbi:MAG: TatD family hydrolase, partial [Planctomycetes bacterium]|nr:TatD family hydrolase [Planctomycetota bacterium]